MRIISRWRRPCKPIALVDMDNTKNNFDARFENRVQHIVPPEIWETRNKAEYWIENIFDEKYHKEIYNILDEEGFFLGLEPLPGAIEAVHEMMEEEIEVLVCTTPHFGSKFCINEKNEWIEKYLGPQFVRRVIPTYDKTIIYGDVLIDDKPEIHGLMEDNPFWTHILFDHRHNKHVDTAHRLTDWKDWRDVVYPILKSQGF